MALYELSIQESQNVKRPCHPTMAQTLHWINSIHDQTSEAESEPVRDEDSSKGKGENTQEAERRGRKYQLGCKYALRTHILIQYRKLSTE